MFRPGKNYKPRSKKPPVKITREEIEKAMKEYKGEITFLENESRDENYNPVRTSRG